jgi:hypothetical protein
MGNREKGKQMKRILIALTIAAGLLFVMRTRQHPASVSLPEATPALAARQNGPVARTTRPAAAPADARTVQIWNLAARIEQAAAGDDEAEQQRALGEFLRELAAHDPNVAAGILARLGSGPFREDYLARLGQLWGAKSSAEALAWAATLANPNERGMAMKAIALEMAQTDPRAGAAVLDEANAPYDEEARANLAQVWAGSDITGATEWALRNPEGAARDGAVARVAFVMAAANPREAVNLVAGRMAPGEKQTEAAISILHQWARQDSAAAREWVERFPSGPLRERAERELSGALAKKGGP